MTNNSELSLLDKTDQLKGSFLAGIPSDHVTPWVGLVPLVPLFEGEELLVSEFHWSLVIMLGHRYNIIMVARRS